MNAVGTGPEKPGDPVQDAWTDAFADPNADSLDALVAAVEARTRTDVLREAAAEIEAVQARIDVQHVAEFGSLDGDAETEGATVRYMAGILRAMADPAIKRAAGPAFTPAPDACQFHAFTGQPGTPCPDCTHGRYADCHPRQD